jgi:GT2 family glycosyltransferase
MNPTMAVIIATKDRAEALEKYSLPSLSRSDYADFAVVVWDASVNDSARMVAEKKRPYFLEYIKAPRVGSSSQRNDAIRYVLDSYPSARYIVFIDDDSELSPDALSGVTEGFFLRGDVWGINIPVEVPDGGGYWISSLLNLKNRVVLPPFLYNLPACKEDQPSAEIEWISGCGMAFRAELFRDHRLKFPEQFELFGGYAWGEDFALSFFVHKKLQKKLINAPKGHLVHHVHGGARLDAKRMMAARWHNMHLLFEAFYRDAPKLKYFFFKFLFKSVFFLALSKKMFSLRSLEPFSGYLEARLALKRGIKIFDETYTARCYTEKMGNMLL